MLDLNKVYCGDSEQVLKEIDDETIDLVVTSPPYSNLRHYNNSLTEWNNEKFCNIAIAIEIWEIVIEMNNSMHNSNT